MRNLLRGLFVLALCLQGARAGLAQSAQRTAVTPPPKPPQNAGPFNFTPVVAEMDFDGFLAKVIVFKDSTRTWHVTLPNGWKAAGSSSELYLTNPQVPDSRITLRMSSLEAPAKYDEGWIETTKPLIMGGLPKDSNEQKIVNVTPNVLNIQGWTSIEFKVSYDRFGRRFSTGWLFLTLVDRRFLEVIYSAPEDKFPVVRAAAVNMLNGWEIHVVPAKAAAR